MKIRDFFPIIGIAIFAYLLIKIDLSRVLKEIVNVKISFLIIAVVLIIILIPMQTLKWFIIARNQKINVPFLEAVRINLIGSFYGFITPAKVGNVIRASYLKKYSNNNLGKGVGNFVLDKIFDLCSLGLLVVIASFFFQQIIPIGVFLPLLLLFSFIVLLGVIMSEKLGRMIMVGGKRLIGNIIPEKLKEKIKEGFYSFHEDRPKKKFLLVFFLLNLATWVVLYLFMFFIGLSVGIELPFFYYLIILPVATLVAQIPITINGLGTREVTMIGLFGILGVEATKVFSMSLIGLGLGEIIPAIIGFFLSLKREK